MKKTLLFVLLCSMTTYGQLLPNSGFENWSLINNIEEPNAWTTNNSQWVLDPIDEQCGIMSSDYKSGNYSIEVASNALGIEGAFPGEVEIQLTPNTLPQSLEAYVKVLELNTPARARIEVWSFYNNEAELVGSWEGHQVMTSFSLVSLPLQYTFPGSDFIIVRLVAFTTPGGYDGYQLFDPIFLTVPTQPSQYFFYEPSFLNNFILPIPVPCSPCGYARFLVDGIGFDEALLSTLDRSFNAISLYPNPTKDVLFLEDKNGMYKTWTIYSMLGKKVNEGLFSSTDSNTIDIKDLAKGMYLIKLSSASGSVTKRFVIK